MQIEIRRASPSDAEAACRVLCRSISDCCIDDHHNDHAILSTWLGNKTTENVKAWFSAPSHYSLVASRDDKIIGVALMTREGKVVLSYVDPAVRFQGVGKSLLRQLEEQAQAWGLRSLRIVSTRTARSFYEQQGFVTGGPVMTAFGTEGVACSKALASPVRRAPCRCGE